MEVLELLSTHRNVNALMQNSTALTHSRSFGEEYSLYHDTKNDNLNSNSNKLKPALVKGRKKKHTTKKNSEKLYDNDQKLITFLHKKGGSQEILQQHQHQQQVN